VKVVILAGGAVRAFQENPDGDAAHPNTLVADAAPIATSGDAEVLHVP
jgi:hypothetical protein